MCMIEIVIAPGLIKTLFGCLFIYTIFRLVILPVLVVIKDLLIVVLNVVKEMFLFLKGLFRGANDARKEKDQKKTKQIIEIEKGSVCPDTFFGRKFSLEEKDKLNLGECIKIENCYSN